MPETVGDKIKYHNDMTTERDIRNQIQFARDKGLEEGMEEGAAKKEAEIIARMKELGMSEDDIARIVGDN